MADLIEEVNGVRMHPSMPIDEARAICDRFKVPYESGWGAGRLMSEVYDETCEATLAAPTFVYDYPREVSPLARTHREDPDMVERFEAVVGGSRAGQRLLGAQRCGRPAARASRPRPPPRRPATRRPRTSTRTTSARSSTGCRRPAGLGIGLDRLVMLISGAQAIREVILFPTMRPEPGTAVRATRAGLSSSSVPDRGVDGSPPPTGGRGARRPRRTAAGVRAASARAARARLLTALGGILCLLALLPGVHHRLGIENLLGDVSLRVAGHIASMLVGVTLILLALQLARGKQRAWQAAVVLFALGAVVHVLKGPHPIMVAYTLGMLIALLATRDSFTARPDSGSLLTRGALRARLPAIAFGFGVGDAAARAGARRRAADRRAASCTRSPPA